MAKRSPLNSRTRLFESLTDGLNKPVQQGPLSRELIQFLNQFLTQAETQADVSASESHTIADTSETVDRSDIEAKLDALGVEINKINDLIDKLQVAKLME